MLMPDFQLRKVLLLSSLSLFMGSAHSNVSVVPMVLDIVGGDKAVEQFRVSSQSDAVQYLEVNVKRVLHPATPQETEVDEDPAAVTGLIASPRRIVLPAGASRVVRLMPFTTPISEMVYRVYVSPVSTPPQVGDDSAVDDATVRSNVKLKIRWGVLVYLKPPKAVHSVELDATQQHLVNDGNVRVRVERLGRCRAKAQDDCEWLTIDRNLFPGNVISIPNKKISDDIVRAQMRFGNDAKRDKVWK